MYLDEPVDDTRNNYSQSTQHFGQSDWNVEVMKIQTHFRPVVPGCAGCAGCAMANPYFGRSVNPISTRGDRLCPPNYYWHTRIFRPSDGPAFYT